MWDWTRVGIIITLITESAVAIVYVVRLEGRINVLSSEIVTLRGQQARMSEWLVRVEAKLDRALETRHIK